MTNRLFGTNTTRVSAYVWCQGLHSPVVGDEGVTGLRIGIGVGRRHAAVHEDPQRHMVTLKDRRLHVHHVTQEVNTGRPLRLPVL